MTVVPLEVLKELAARVPETPSHNRSSTMAGFDVGEWIKLRGLDAIGPSEWKGGRRWIFPTCPWNSNHDDRAAFVIQFSDGAIAAGCLHNGCRGRNWHALRSLLEPGWHPQAFTGNPTIDPPHDTAWFPPVPFHHFDLPAFPVEALPSWLRDYVQSLAVATQTPVDLAAMLALAVGAVACAKKVSVCIKPGWSEPLNIFVVVALAPGNRKSTVFKSMTEPVEDHERLEAQHLGPEIAREKAAFKIQESRLKRLQDQAAAATKSEDQERLKLEVTSLAAEISASKTLVAPRYVADDCTTERLTTLLRDQGGRIAVMSAEGDVFDLMAGRYSQNSMANFGVYLKGHAGDSIRIDRVGRPPEHIKNPALTLGLAVQPEVIRGLISKPGFRGRGLLGRFLYSFPPSPLGRRDTNASAVPDHVASSYRSNVSALLDLPLRKDADGEAYPHELVLNVAARDRLNDFERWIEPQLAEFGELGSITDWAGKLVGAVARIAGILHMAGLAGTPGAWDEPISQDTVENAIRIGHYLISHAKASYAEMGADEFVGHAKTILRWIKQNSSQSFSKRDLHQALRASFRRVDDLERPLTILIAHGFIRQREAPPSGPGRPASPIYDINPFGAAELERQTLYDANNSEDCEDCERHPRVEPDSELNDAGA